MKKLLIISISILLLSSCKIKNNNYSEKGETNKQLYGVIGADSVFQYTLKNKNGMKVKIINYGGTVTNLFVPDKTGVMGDVVLGFDSLSGYLEKENPYFGCLVGRYANRIAEAQFTLDGKKFTLTANNNGNSLHGGLKGFDKVIWKVKEFSNTELLLSYLSKDGEEGYPGNLSVEVKYSFGDDNSLQIYYHAITDKATPVNLTNHSYFNLSAGTDSTILDHELWVNAGGYTPVNEQLIPTGEIDTVQGTPMDFLKAKKIGRDLSQVNGGFDHNWVLNSTGNEPEKIATLSHTVSGRVMEVFTTEPGLQFYSGNFLDGTLFGKNKNRYVKHAGLCLETQHYPDSPNRPEFPNTILQPGKTYNQITIYKFSVK